MNNRIYAAFCLGVALLGFFFSAVTIVFGAHTDREITMHQCAHFDSVTGAFTWNKP